VHTDKTTDRYELICAIVNFGSGSRVLQLAKECGIPGGTVVLGKGTSRNRMLQILELCDVRKEIVLMIAERSVAAAALQRIAKKLQLHKSYHGIAFTMPLAAFLGSGDYRYIYRETGGGKNTVFNSIFVIVDRGRGEEVMDSARRAGAKGGTIIGARGSGIHEKGRLFRMDIEPEKEVVLILSDRHQTEAIVKSVRDDLHIDEPGMGVIFVQDVHETYGVLE